MTALKWQRISDSDGTTIMYTAPAGPSEPRQPHYSYRIYPVGSLHNTNVVVGYMVSQWRGEQQVSDVGTIPFPHGLGELRLDAAKRAAQEDYDRLTIN